MTIDTKHDICPQCLYVKCKTSKLCQKCFLQNKKGTKHSKETKAKMSLARSGENNPRWSDNISYRGIHHWISRCLGKPKKCVNCKNTELSHRQYHWANISGKYKREISDWQRMCASCHKYFDKKQK